MRLKRAIALGAAGIAAATLTAVVSTPARADSSPTNPFSTAFVGPSFAASAFGAEAGGLLNLRPTALANCPEPGTAKNAAALALNTRGLANVNALTGQCAVSPFLDQTDAQGTVANASLLNNLIAVTAVDSRCQVVDGVAIWGSTYGSLIVRTNYAKQGDGSLLIPGIAQIWVNRKFNVNGVVSTIGVQVDVLPVKVGSVTVRAAQRIILGFCSISTFRGD